MKNHIFGTYVDGEFVKISRVEDMTTREIEQCIEGCLGEVNPVFTEELKKRLHPGTMDLISPL